jgi:Flp pilus assembly protein TadG
MRSRQRKPSIWIRRYLRSLHFHCAADDGSALVEATVLVPVLFVLMFGVYEFSWYFFDQHRVDTGIRDAARYLGHSYCNTATTCSFSGTAIANAKNLAVCGTIAACTTPRVSGWTTADVNDPVISGAGASQVVSISTSFTYVPLGLFGYLGISSLPISSTHQERLIADSAS